MDSTTVEGAIEQLSRHKLVLKIATDGAAEEDAVDCALESSTADSRRSTIQLCFFGKDELLQGPHSRPPWPGKQITNSSTLLVEVGIFKVVAHGKVVPLEGNLQAREIV